MGEVQHKAEPGQATQEAVAGLRSRFGLSTGDAAPVAAQPQGTVPSAPPPAQAPPQPDAPAPGQEMEQMRQDLAKSQAANEALLEHVAKLVEATKPPPAPPAPPDIPEEPRPKDFDERTAADQMVWIAGQAAKREAALAAHQAITGAHESFKETMQPLLSQAAQAFEVTDAIRIRSEFPQYPWAKYKAAIDAKRAEIPHLNATEAAVLVARERGDMAALQPPTQAPPVSTPGTPSTQAAAAGPPAGRNRTPAMPNKQQLLARVGELRRQGRTTEANAYIHEAIKQSVRVPQGMKTQEGR